MRQNIPFLGIKRNSPAQTVEDGAAYDIINARFKDGAWRPVGEKEVIFDNSEINTSEFIHQINENVYCIVSWDYVDGAPASIFTYKVYENNVLEKTDTINIESWLDESLTVHYTQLNNWLIMSNDNKDAKIFLYDVDAQSYTLFEIPVPVGAQFQALQNSSGDIKKVFEWQSGEDTVYESRDDAAQALYFMIQGEKYEEGSFVGKVVLTAAIKLFNNTYVKFSRPVILEVGDLEGRWYVQFVDTMPVYKLEIKWKDYIVQYLIDVNQDEIDYLNSISEIVSSISIFSSVPVMHKSFETIEEDTMTALNDNGKYTDKYVFENSVFYRVKDISLSELSTTADFEDLSFPNVESLPSYQVLPAEDKAKHKLSCVNPFVYNDRIWLSNVKTNIGEPQRLGNLIQPHVLYPEETGSDYTLFAEIDIMTDQGVKTVVGQEETFNYANSSSQPSFSILPGAILSYPDQRAKKFRICMKSGASDKYVAWDLEMIQHPYYDLAYYIVSGDPLSISNIPAIRDLVALGSYNSSFIESNRLIASDQNNPFVYDSKHSNKVSQGTIIGIGSNAEAISEGQFGSYPLYIFTDGGIYVMDLGRGEILINSIQPLNKHVCNNSFSIIPVQGGVVFSTREGLFYLSGRNPVEISSEIEGDYSNPIALAGNYNDIAGVSAADWNNNSPSYFACLKSFREYLRESYFGYDPEHNELIVAPHGTNARFSFVFQLDTKTWYKLPFRIYSFQLFNNKTIAVTFDGTDWVGVDVGSEVSTSSDQISFFIQTREMKLQRDSLKKIIRMVLRNYYYYFSDQPLRCYLYGSPDGINWYYISGNSVSSEHEDMIITGGNYSCKHYIVVLRGNSNIHSYISHMNIDFNVKLGSKLRK